MFMLYHIFLFAYLGYVSCENNVAVVTWASAKSVQQFQFNHQTIQDYANKHHYARIVNTTQYDFSHDFMNYCKRESNSNFEECVSRSSYWYKPYVIRDLCHAYDYILYIDNDMVINRKDIDISTFLKYGSEDTVIFASFMGARVNAGIFLMKGRSVCIDFIDSWVNQVGFYADDNGALNHALLEYRNLNYHGECAAIAKAIEWNQLRGISPADVGSELQSAYKKVDNCLMDGYGLHYGDGNTCECVDTQVTPYVTLICPHSTPTHVSLQSEDVKLAAYRGRQCLQHACNSDYSFAIHSKKTKQCNAKDMMDVGVDCIRKICPPYKVVDPQGYEKMHTSLSDNESGQHLHPSVLSDEAPIKMLPMSYTEWHICRLYEENMYGQGRHLDTVGRFQIEDLSGYKLQEGDRKSFISDKASYTQTVQLKVGHAPKYNFDVKNSRSLYELIGRQQDLTESEFEIFIKQGEWKKLLKPCYNQELPVYFWESKSAGWILANFGDAVNKDIATGLLQPGNSASQESQPLKSPLFTSKGLFIPTKKKPNNDFPKKILMVGSVLLNANKGDVIWGSGLHFDTNATYKFPFSGGLDVRAVRGPLSASVLGDLNAENHPHLTLGDPALLLPLFFKTHLMLDRMDQSPDGTKQGNFGKDVVNGQNGTKSEGMLKQYCVVPHYVDIEGVKLTPRQKKLAKLSPNRMTFPIEKSQEEYYRDYPYSNQWRIKILSPGLSASEMVEAMVKCDLILSSSLHGVIFGEMYRVPTRWLFNPNLFLSSQVESSLKYNDYFLSTGRACFHPATSLEDGLRIGGLEPFSKYKWASMVKHLLLTFPYERVCSQPPGQQQRQAIEASATKLHKPQAEAIGSDSGVVASSVGGGVLMNYNTPQLLSRHQYVKSVKQIVVPGFPDAFNPSIVRYNHMLLFSFRTRIKTPNGPVSPDGNRMGLAFLSGTTSFSVTSDVQIIEFENPYGTTPSRAHDPRLVVTPSGQLKILYSNLYALELPYDPVKNQKRLRMFRETRRIFMNTLYLDGGSKSNNIHGPVLGPPQVVTNYHGSEMRFKEQKNWIPFEYDRRMYYVQHIHPHKIVTILKETAVRLSAPVLYETESPDVFWDYGEMRGGTPAVLLPSAFNSVSSSVQEQTGEYIAIFHSSKMMKTTHSNGENMQHYFMGAYTFEAKPPFRITRMSASPILFRGIYESPNYPTYKPIRCVFPMGILIEEDGIGLHNNNSSALIHITIGKQDHESWVVTLDMAMFLKTLRVIPQDIPNQALDESRTRTWAANPSIMKSILSREAV